MAFRIEDLNPEQREAATYTGGPLLILAGAGTGKTRTITARVAWLLSRGADPREILAVTFTNKAANEMKERIAEMTQRQHAKALTASTFHALCLRILRKEAARLGYKPNFTVLDESDQIGLLRKIAAKTAARDEKLDPAIARAWISRAKNQGWNPPEDDESLLGAVFRRYNENLRMLNAMDFDDLLVQAVRLLGEHDDVRERWRARARHLLVDEFQDTNRLQLELVILLAGPGRPDVCVVGDDDQSIYGWRGAEISNILEFEKHFPKPRIIRLERNYRSTAPILDAANRVIRHNARRHPKALRSQAGEGEPVRLLSVPDDREEADFVASEIEDVLRDSRQTPNDFAILYRMNAQSRVFEEELRRRRIPYRLVGGQSFYDRREVKDVTAHMTVLCQPDSDPALLRILQAPPRGIGAVAVERALAFSAEHHQSLFQAMASPEFLSTCSRKLVAAIGKFRDEVLECRERISLESPARVLRGWLEESCYFADLRQSCKTTEEADSRCENVYELLRALEEACQRPGGSLPAFLDDITLDRERAEDRQEKAAGVTLITLHAAKGLEFPVVYLVGIEDGVLPHERSKAEGTLDEERRLFYVGVTRAMRRLTLTWCCQRKRYGSPVSCRPSPFLREILGEGVLEESYDRLVNRPLSGDEVAARFAALRESLRRNAAVNPG